MKKRMMAMLMTAILVIASIPFTAFADEMPAEVLGGEAMEAVAAEAAEAEAVPAAAGEEAEAAEQAADAGLLGADPTTVTTFAELKAAVEAATAGVETTIKLGGDINDMTAPLIIAAGRIIVLDLNGKNLNRGLADSQADSNGSVIDMNSGASLTLRDSLGGGMVTGGNSVGCGGGVCVRSRATFTMEGGTISGNKSKSYGAGVAVVSDTEAKVVMKGGRISGNESYYSDKYSGAGIHFAGNVGTGGRLYVGGDAFVGNNVRIKDGEKIASNAWLADKLTIGTGENGVPKPTKNMSIGVAFTSAPQPGQEVQFTENASSGDEQYFIPDNGELKVAYNSAGYLTLQYPTLSIKSDKSTYNVGEKITLTFKTNFVDAGTKIVVTDGTGTMKVSVKEDGTAEFLVNAVKAGSITYTAAIADPKLEAATTITVIDVPKTYHTVKFNTFGGTPVPETQAVLENGKAARPQKDPAKDGYEFAGWYADAGCTNPYNFNMPINRDITIFAKWTKKPGPKPDPTPSSDDTSEPLFTGNLNNPVKNGRWTQDANGVWNYTSSEVFRNTWGYIANPYAQEGQHQADWFYFDQYGHMLTGWQLINGKWYYLNPTKDGTLGACFIGPGKTPDGWEVDASGAWTGR
ncbi:MAG: InlB B-repeat-containing protein [Eubacteriales bacterium]|nr:InlB B-repeat-containing protein [Eubacteriales bacterium]